MKLRHILVATAVAVGLAAGSASAQTVSVAGTAVPWDPTVSGNPVIDTDGATAANVSPRIAHSR